MRYFFAFGRHDSLLLRVLGEVDRLGTSAQLGVESLLMCESIQSSVHGELLLRASQFRFIFCKRRILGLFFVFLLDGYWKEI